MNYTEALTAAMNGKMIGRLNSPVSECLAVDFSRAAWSPADGGTKLFLPLVQLLKPGKPPYTPSADDMAANNWHAVD